MVMSFARVNRDSKRTIYIAAFFALLSCSASAWAGAVLDLPMKKGGSLTYRYAERHPGLWGGGIDINGIENGTQTLPILRGRLRFADSGFVSSKGNGLSWGSGGTLSMHGCADLNLDSKCDKGDIRGTLMKASFLNAELIQQNGKEIFKAEIVEQLNPQLAAALHLPTTHTAELELTLAQLRDGRWWGRDGVQGGFLRECDPVQAVSEPSSIWLLSSILVCGVAMRYRRNLL